uniref:PPM-type phosphatase domain-containing protein n=1 Tax=Pyramimonas obovata TaxID=1411642 RepID=A0A7S0R733_9CHLO|mmetsp:Transcript_27315/g.59682  ORF Transcript_27315/g.59682 Transcript_27315/m.59682 type:complete len:606 (+) Transcript_27315:349-2166(+)
MAQMETSEGTFESMPQVTYGVAMRPTKKNEDRFLVFAKPIPGLADGIVGVFDGHNGDGASEFLQLQIVPLLKKHALSEKLDESGWPTNINAILSNTFLKLDQTVRDLMPCGSTCSVILIKQLGNEVLVKVAWVGDSRCSVHDSLSNGYRDVSVDHRADNLDEQRRIMHACLDTISNQHLAGWRTSGTISVEERDKLLNVSSVLLRDNAFSSNATLQHPAMQMTHTDFSHGLDPRMLGIGSVHGIDPSGAPKETRSVHGLARSAHSNARSAHSARSGHSNSSPAHNGEKPKSRLGGPQGADASRMGFMASYHGQPSLPATKSDKGDIDTTSLVMPKFDESKTGLLFKNEPSGDVPSLEDSTRGTRRIKQAGHANEPAEPEVVFLRRSSMCEVRTRGNEDKRRLSLTAPRSFALGEQLVPGATTSMRALWPQGSSQDLTEPHEENRVAQLGGSANDLVATFKNATVASTHNSSRTPKMQIYNRQYGMLESSCENQELEVITRENEGVVFCGRYRTETGRLVGNARVFLPSGISVMCTRCIGDREARLGSGAAIASAPQIADLALTLAPGGGDASCSPPTGSGTCWRRPRCTSWCASRRPRARRRRSW